MTNKDGNNKDTHNSQRKFKTKCTKKFSTFYIWWFKKEYPKLGGLLDFAEALTCSQTSSIFPYYFIEAYLINFSEPTCSIHLYFISFYNFSSYYLILSISHSHSLPSLWIWYSFVV